MHFYLFFCFHFRWNFASPARNSIKLTVDLVNLCSMNVTDWFDWDGRIVHVRTFGWWMASDNFIVFIKHNKFKQKQKNERMRSIVLLSRLRQWLWPAGRLRLFYGTLTSRCRVQRVNESAYPVNNFNLSNLRLRMTIVIMNSNWMMLCGVSVELVSFLSAWQKI